MYEAFIDLDELIVRCRDKSSKKFIQEAVSCYRAGAFRSCIVSTWNAVVFDFLHKLRELELLGDREAAKILEEFEDLRSSGKKFKELWQFESNIPDIAFTKFELISSVEKLDIERLFDDRSRCAHPSMTSLEEPFEATAELARYHLRNAVTNLLERPPVQGRAATTRIFQDIKSEYFPADPDLAIKYFQKSPLARARRLLIKDIVIGLTKSLLIEDYPEDERLRQFSALTAVSSMYPSETREILNNQLSDIILNRVTDENWAKVIFYLGSINSWDSLDEPCRLKAESYINKIDIFESHQGLFAFRRLSQKAILILIKASYIDFLRETVVKKLQIPLKDLISLKENCKDQNFKEKILIPVLRGLSSQATLDELLSMRSEALLRSDEAIQSYIEQRVKTSSLVKLTSVASKYQDKWLFNLIEPVLEEKITTTNLEDLLVAKSNYKLIDEPKNLIVDLFNNSIDKQVKEEIETASLDEVVLLMKSYDDRFFIELIEPELEQKIPAASLASLLEAKLNYKLIDQPKAKILDLLDEAITAEVGTVTFDDLLDQFDGRRYLNEINDELIEGALKNNIHALIDRFAKSGSFDSAGSNVRLLIKIAGYLSSEQWRSILEAFFQNDQLYCSYSCYSGIEALFKKSLELSISVQPYWLSFRENLNVLDNPRSNNLKRLIDSHI